VRSSQEQESEKSERVPTLTDQRYSQSLERGLGILRCFSPEQSVLGIAEIADLTGMSRSTTHRYVITLVALTFLEQGLSRKYRLGLRVNDLGMAKLNSMGLREPSRPFLEELRRHTSFTASLSVLDGPEILYVERARSFRRGQHEINLNIRLGSRLPAYCTSMGKVLLANLSKVNQNDLITNMVMSKRGPNSIKSKKALHLELECVFDDGMAVNEEELAPGLVSIACPVCGESGEVVAAINLAAHVSMISLEEMVDRFLPDLLAAAESISARLGHRPEDEATQ
jgi:IclR family transcriptional regulator, pca regulon regulatory protein